MNVKQMIDKCGLEHVAFFTITFADHVTDRKEAQRRWNSLASHVMRTRFARWLRVFERQISGRIHYHGLLDLGADIRTGFDFDAYRAARAARTPQERRTLTRRYADSAAARLREEWRFWRATAPRYGFGRAEILPIWSNAEAVSRYVGKYIAKHIEAREDQDKGTRLVCYSRGWKPCSSNFAWNSYGAKQWRENLHNFANAIGLSSYEELLPALGSKWAHIYREAILAMSTPQHERNLNFDASRSGSLEPRTRDGCLNSSAENLGEAKFPAIASHQWRMPALLNEARNGTSGFSFERS